MHPGVINRWALVALAGWPLLTWGQLPQDPTKPPDAPTPGSAAPRVPCVEMTIVAVDRKVAVVDGLRLREGDSLGTAVVREISATGIAVEEGGALRRHLMGNCPPNPPR